MLLKNVAGQGVPLYAYIIATGLPKTGDAANITGYSSIDGTVTGTVFGTANPTELDATNMKGIYWQPLAQSETNGNAIAFSWSSVTSGIAIDPLFVFTTGVNLPAVAHSGASGLITSGTGTGQLKVTSGIVDLPAVTTDWLTAAGVKADAVTKIAAGTMDQFAVATDSVQASPTPTTTAFAGSSALSSTNDWYIGSVCVFTSGTLDGIARKITAYTGASRLITVTAAWPTAPTAADTFRILGRID